MPGGEELDEITDLGPLRRGSLERRQTPGIQPRPVRDRLPGSDEGLHDDLGGCRMIGRRGGTVVATHHPLVEQLVERPTHARARETALPADLCRRGPGAAQEELVDVLGLGADTQLGENPLGHPPPPTTAPTTPGFAARIPRVSQTSRLVRWAAGIGLALTLAACASPSPPPTETPMSSTSPTSDHAMHAVSDLAQRLGVDAAHIDVVSDEAVTWRDTSLGCPQPGKVYGQALVDGRRLVLEVRGRAFSYHSGGATAPFLCENPQPPATSS